MAYGFLYQKIFKLCIISTKVNLIGLSLFITIFYILFSKLTYHYVIIDTKALLIYASWDCQRQTDPSVHGVSITSNQLILLLHNSHFTPCLPPWKLPPSLNVCSMSVESSRSWATMWKREQRKTQSTTYWRHFYGFTVFICHARFIKLVTKSQRWSLIGYIT